MVGVAESTWLLAYMGLVENEEVDVAAKVATHSTHVLNVTLSQRN